MQISTRFPFRWTQTNQANRCISKSSFQWLYPQMNRIIQSRDNRSESWLESLHFCLLFSMHAFSYSFCILVFSSCTSCLCTKLAKQYKLEEPEQVPFEKWFVLYKEPGLLVDCRCWNLTYSKCKKNGNCNGMEPLFFGAFGIWLKSKKKAQAPSLVRLSTWA
jgi:hypothetical protein